MTDFGKGASLRVRKTVKRKKEKKMDYQEIAVELYEIAINETNEKIVEQASALLDVICDEKGITI